MSVQNQKMALRRPAMLMRLNVALFGSVCGVIASGFATLTCPLSPSCWGMHVRPATQVLCDRMGLAEGRKLSYGPVGPQAVTFPSRRVSCRCAAFGGSA